MKSFDPYFVRSSCVVAALALLAACQPAKAYQCSEDADCVLAREQGICVSTSRCAYPDDDCPSGYAYPEGAGQSLAGVCLPPGVVSATDGAVEGADTDTDGATTTASTGSMGGSGS